MSSNLKTLLGWLLVVAGILLVLDWQDTAEQLRQESETSTRLRQRLEQQTREVDWRAVARTAQDAQGAWLDRLVEVRRTERLEAALRERAHQSLAQRIVIVDDQHAAARAILSLRW